MASIWINGQLVDERSAGVSVRDAGLLHAAGVFTTMRAAGGGVVRLDRHLARVRHSCESLGVPLPYGDVELAAGIDALLAENALSDARLRLTITRGVPVEGTGLRPTVFVSAGAIEPYPAELYERGMTVIAHDAFKLNPYDPQAGHKTLDYLSRFAALRDAQQRGGQEALLFNVHNYLQSAAIANVFLVKRGAIVTPPTADELRDDPAARAATPYPRSNVLPGITRGQILEAATADAIAIERRAIAIDDVLSADEIFLSNSLLGVMPVCRVERRAIGDERPGAVTRRMMHAVGGAT